MGSGGKGWGKHQVYWGELGGCQISDPPIEGQRFYVEAKGGADGADVLPAQPLHHGGLPSIVEATAGHRVAEY